METLPIYIPTLFITLTGITIYVLYRASNKSQMVLIISLIWLILQGIISSQGFYLATNTIPPRFTMVILPPMVLMGMLFTTAKGKIFIDQANPKWLTGLHTVRILVEIGLFNLFLHKYIPKIMTFEGHNFDILSGITAPIMLYFGYYKNKLSKNVLLLWNFACLGLLLNIVATAILSAPFKFQQFGFDQPNIAI